MIMNILDFDKRIARRIDFLFGEGSRNDKALYAGLVSSICFSVIAANPDAERLFMELTEVPGPDEKLLPGFRRNKDGELMYSAAWL